VEDEEALESRAIISQLPDAIQHQVDDLLPDGVVSSGVVVGGVLLSGDELLGVVQLAVRAVADLVDYGGLKIDEHSPGHIIASSGLAEEGVEGVVSTSQGLVGGHGAVGRDPVLQTVQLPAGVAHLHSGLPHMDGDALTHFGLM